MPLSFEHLKQLAREPSPDRRGALLRAISATFFEEAQRTPTELDLFDEIMDQVLADVEPLARRELAERLCDLAQPPHRTLVRLAGDTIDIAGSVLSRSPALGDGDLAPIAHEKSQDHLLAIAGRKTLSECITDILVVRGNDNVAGKVTANQGARFSHVGFDTLAGRAAGSEAILNRLVMRGDLPERIATGLLPVLAASIAAKIEATNAEVANMSARQLVDAARHLLAERLRAEAHRARPLAILNDQVERGNLSVGETVIELADADELVDLAAFIGMRLNLRSSTIVRNLFGPGEESLMLICRAAALNLDAFSAILRLRRRRRRGSVTEPVRLMKDYLRIPRPMADDVLRSVRDKERVL